MNRFSFGLLAAASALSFAPAAMAASDYLLEIDGVEGEAAASIEIASWSWGASNAASVSSPRDAASGLATGRRQSRPSVTASQNTQSLRGRATVSDLSMVRNADMSSLGSLDEIQGFALTFDKASPMLAKICTGKHFSSVQLRGRGETFALENAAVTGCTASAGAPPATPDTTARTYNWDLKSAKRESSVAACASGVCAVEAVTLTITGQMRHQKTGHVTLLK
jgi:type VI protein secretion system component Hcp